MFEQLVQYNDIGLLILRLAVAAIFIYHSMPKLKNAKSIAPMLGAPAVIVLLLGVVEMLSSLGLVFGVYVRLAALLLAIVMLGAIYFKTVKWSIPFAAMDKTGWEFDLILLTASIILLISGGGAIGIGI